ncbi:MAG TPA: acyl-CoA dehydrogenase family protein [Tepidisphaeraceae bacterium]
MQYAELHTLREILPGISSRADRLDQSGDWPQEDLRILATIGAMRWSVPLEFGGEDLSPIELHFRYETIASASLTTALILTQRDSAISLLAAAENSPLRSELLPRLANNEIFTTVGIAQLTTSRQRGAPALRATPIEGGYRLDGEIPWASGAAHADFIVAGAVLEDRRQILFALPMNLSGVSAQPPLPLVALRGSHTTSVVCENAKLDERQILNGPVEQALSIRRKSLSIGQAFLATGLASAALNLIAEIDSDAARNTHAQLQDQLIQVRGGILDFCNPALQPNPAAGAALRGQSIDLALRATHAAVSLHKGTALLADHPAQRLAREAMFLLVWSCPSAVVDCTLDLLASAPSPSGRGLG